MLNEIQCETLLLNSFKYTNFNWSIQLYPELIKYLTLLNQIEVGLKTIIYFYKSLYVSAFNNYFYFTHCYNVFVH